MLAEYVGDSGPVSPSVESGGPVRVAPEVQSEPTAVAAAYVRQGVDDNPRPRSADRPTRPCAWFLVPITSSMITCHLGGQRDKGRDRHTGQPGAGSGRGRPWEGARHIPPAFVSIPVARPRGALRSLVVIRSDPPKGTNAGNR